eukprot:Tbor_TRINITY_DN4137_c0_g1::TRINITY_DN4137_c0_g1_i1::g.26485::m.26485/K03434/PIGL; N-acetylglucosaminylphosphatidylinositol deacetylase
MLVLFLLLLSLIFLLGWSRAANGLSPSIKGPVLLVFAHPDDEAMFFSPLLMYLNEINVRCSFLCLSNGNFAGLGKIREMELIASARVYNPEIEVTVINNDAFMDGMDNVWDPQEVATTVHNHIHKPSEGNKDNSFPTVITFDSKGVSGHPNHIAVYNGVKILADRERDHGRQGRLFLKLHTRPSVCSKYCGPFAMLHGILSYLFVSTESHHMEVTPANMGEPVDGVKVYPDAAKNTNAWTLLIRPTNVLSSFRGMQAHQSQLVWFRYLFVCFSSYTFINELKSM